MQEVSEIGRAARRGLEKIEEDVEKLKEGVERNPLVRSPALVALITKEFKTIEDIEEDIAEKRMDIKLAVTRMVDRGLNRKGVKAALGRRKLVARGGIEQMDETLALICGIGALGIQGELFESGNGAATNGNSED